LNLCFGPFLVDVVMLYIGVSPTVLLFLVPFQVTIAVFVHANLNWTFGPLKYVVATPVFHRWHHTSPTEGGSRNFAPTFALWDVLFGTFHMPEGQLPQNYGVDDPQFPHDFLRQMIFPFRSRNAGIGAVLARPLNAPASAIGSVGPQPES
jgi:sterol desaturase/sphingolipid hydroxylase (fatty acid hydroxylase superfamily)